MALKSSPFHFCLQSTQFVAATLDSLSSCSQHSPPSKPSYELSFHTAGFLHKEARKHGSWSSAAVLCTTQSCFSCGSSIVSKICLCSRHSQQRQQDRFAGKCLSSVEADHGIVDDASLSDCATEEPFNSSANNKKMVRTLRLAPKPPMGKIFQESPVKCEEELDSCEANVMAEPEQVTIPAQKITAFKAAEVPPSGTFFSCKKERRRWRFDRRAQAEELFLSRMQLQDDKASKDLISLINYVRFVLHVKHHIGQRLEPKDESLIMEKLLPYHPDREEKLEKGVKFIKVDWHPEYQTRCFFIVRDDCSSIDFSFRKCILQFGQEVVGLDTAKRLLDLAFF